MLVRYFTLISPDVSFVSAIFGGDGPNRSTNPSRAGYPLIAAADDLAFSQSPLWCAYRPFIAPILKGRRKGSTPDPSRIDQS